MCSRWVHFAITQSLDIHFTSLAVEHGTASRDLSFQGSSAPLMFFLYRVKWGEPFQGECVDKYELSENGNQIMQTSTYTRNSNGKTTVFKTLWNRA